MRPGRYWSLMGPHLVRIDMTPHGAVPEQRPTGTAHALAVEMAGRLRDLSKVEDAILGHQQTPQQCRAAAPESTDIQDLRHPTPPKRPPQNAARHGPAAHDHNGLLAALPAGSVKGPGQSGERASVSSVIARSVATKRSRAKAGGLRSWIATPRRFRRAKQAGLAMTKRIYGRASRPFRCLYTWQALVTRLPWSKGVQVTGHMGRVGIMPLQPANGPTRRPREHRIGPCGHGRAACACRRGPSRAAAPETDRS